LSKILSLVFAFPREIAISIATTIAFMVQVESTGDTERVALHVGLIGIITLGTSLACSIAVRSSRISTLVAWIA